jgi:hypothetical protein
MDGLIKIKMRKKKIAGKKSLEKLMIYGYY